MILLTSSALSASQPPSAATIVVDPSSAAHWHAESGWLDAPASVHEVTRGAALKFAAGPPGRGMKWRHGLAQPISTKGHPFLTLHYRAHGITRSSDYFVHLIAQSGDGAVREYTAIPLSAVVDDEAWHQLCVEVPPLQVNMLAVQLQAASDDSFIEIASIRFSANRSHIRLKDYLAVRPGGSTAEGHRPLAINTNSVAKPWLVDLGMDPAEFDQPQITVQDVPFNIQMPGPQVLATSLEAQDEAAIELGCSAEAIYLLMGARFTGQESPSIGKGPLVQVRQVERFVVRIEYADGVKDLAFPTKLPGGSHIITQEPAVYVIQPTRSSKIKQLHLIDGMRQGQFLLLAATLGPRPRIATSEPASRPTPSLTPASTIPPGAVATDTAALDLSDQQQADALINRVTNSAWLAKPSRLFSVEPAEKIEAKLSVKPLANGQIELALVLTNISPEPVNATTTFPMLTGLSPGGDVKDLGYCFPRRGSVISTSDADLRDPYSGRFPLQFMDVYHPEVGGWYVMIQDKSNTPKTYWLKKKGKIDLGVDYWPTTLRPKQQWTLPAAVLGAHRGDWHDGLQAYRLWLADWYQPLVVRKQWFREVFSFRQHFMHLSMPKPSGIFDKATGKLDLMTIVKADAEKFGGIDYLHLFDWGYTPTHGYRGDYNPWEYLGGLERFTNQLRQVENLGIPVGLYMEGYLVDPQSSIGKANGQAWRILNANGQPCTFFPPCMTMCPNVPAWQDHLTDVYRRIGRETKAKGYYIDEFGNASLYLCHNPNHGHPVPISPLQGEMEMTRRIREAIPSDAALYTEDTPTDVTSQYQDGSFTYAIACTIESLSPVPLNLARFALPDFKTFEIIACDAPLQDDQQAVKRVFFNGEGIWLEGLADDWFTPETRALIAKAHQILRRYRSTFNTLNPEPLVSTRDHNVYANRFSSADDSVWTLYNSSYQTVRGDLLAVDHVPGATYLDVWNDRTVTPRLVDDQAILPLELGPRDTGCVVQHRVSQKGPGTRVPVQ